MNTPHVFRYVRPLLALLIVVGCISYIFALLFKAIPVPNTDVLTLAIGFVLAKLGDVTAYYFGNSKDKSDQEQAARSNTNPPPTP